MWSIINNLYQFSELVRLKWLDLKDNPLDSEFKKVTGECLNAKQCQTCALNTVKFLGNLRVKIGIAKEQKEKEEAEAARKRKVEEEKKKLEKEKKKAKQQKKKMRDMNAKSNAVQDELNHGNKNGVKNKSNEMNQNKKKSGKNIEHNYGFFSFIMTIIRFLLLMMVTYVMFCLTIHIKHGKETPKSVDDVQVILSDGFNYLKELKLVNFFKEVYQLTREVQNSV